MRPTWWCVALALACSEPTVPSRADVYAFNAGPNVFHWPADRLPVRFYARPVGNLRFLVQRGIDLWSSAFLYGEFTGALVGDSTSADIIVATDSAPDVPPDPAWARACDGVTTFDSVDSRNRLTGPVHIRLGVLPGFSAAQAAACLRRTTIHELGHALGILDEANPPNSGDSTDIMFGPPYVDAPSERDHRTMEVLYHTPATILPPP